MLQLWVYECYIYIVISSSELEININWPRKAVNNEIKINITYSGEGEVEQCSPPKRAPMNDFIELRTSCQDYR